MNLGQLVSFPLLVKELTETAARRRTYVLRVVYAVALYGLFTLALPETSDPSGFSRLGIGQRLFEMLTILQAGGIILFLPALMCGRITQEKERDSLVLLFLTDLKPWSIILQKYLGGIVPMFSFLLLGLPLAGVAYACGGLDYDQIVGCLITLTLLVLQIGALSLMASSWCRSTINAFLATYFWGVALYVGPAVLGQILQSLHYIDWHTKEYFDVLIPFAAMDSGVPFKNWGLLQTARLIPVVLSILLFLFLARRFLIRRAFVPSSNRLAALFSRLDALMKRFNRVAGGVVLWREEDALPRENPVFWRETHRRALGKFHYLLRLLVLVEIPTILLCAVLAAGATEGLTIAVVILGALATLVISARAANALVSERVGQTLEVLLTTPLSAREILHQKERALHRIEWVAAIPLLTIFATEAYLMVDSGRGEPRSSGESWISYLTGATLLVAIYLPMITWLSLWIGLRVRTRFQAIVSALAAIVVWGGLAPLLLVVMEIFHVTGSWHWFILSSPVSVFYMNEIHELNWLSPTPWKPILVNAVLYACIALFIRHRLFADAERHMRR